MLAIIYSGNQPTVEEVSRQKTRPHGGDVQLQQQQLIDYRCSFIPTTCKRHCVILRIVSKVGVAENEFHEITKHCSDCPFNVKCFTSLISYDYNIIICRVSNKRS